MDNPANLSPAEMSSEAKRIYVESIARSMEDLAEKLKDPKFSAAMSNDPKATMERAGIILEREAVELLISTDPKRFDALCDKLFDVMDPGLLATMFRPSCDNPKSGSVPG